MGDPRALTHGEAVPSARTRALRAAKQGMDQRIAGCMRHKQRCRWRSHQSSLPLLCRHSPGPGPRVHLFPSPCHWATQCIRHNMCLDSEKRRRKGCQLWYWHPTPVSRHACRGPDRSAAQRFFRFSRACSGCNDPSFSWSDASANCCHHGGGRGLDKKFLQKAQKHILKDPSRSG